MEEWQYWTAEEHESAMDEYDELYSKITKKINVDLIQDLGRLLELEYIFAKLEDVL